MIGKERGDAGRGAARKAPGSKGANAGAKVAVKLNVKSAKAAKRAASKKRAATVGAPPPKSKIRSARPTHRIDPLQAAPQYFDRLLALYPDAHCELDYQSPWQLLVATILSAQTTDKRVNMVTPALFAAYPTPSALAAARQEDVEAIIKSTGFFRNKAKAIIGVAGAVVDRHQGQVPPRLEDLVLLPGVGRKTANVVLGNAFSINEGVVVDTHVTRLANRLGLTSQSDPVKIEQDLMQLLPRDRWTMLSHLLIWHGRRICDAKKPRCGECPLNTLCPSARVA